MSVKRQKFESGRVNAVECRNCQIDSGDLYVAALGLKDIFIQVKNGVVTVRKRNTDEDDCGDSDL